MKFSIILLLLAAIQAVDLQTSVSKIERVEMKELSGEDSVDDNSGPDTLTASPAITPGGKDADSKGSLQDESPFVRIGTTPLPIVSKISDIFTSPAPTFQSDISSPSSVPVSVQQPNQIYPTPLPFVSMRSNVLTDQVPTFQPDIADRLSNPVSVNQPNLASPTSYEISAPLSPNLTYVVIRVSLEPSQNSLLTQEPLQKSNNVQQISLQQPLAYPQTLAPNSQQIYRQNSPRYEWYENLETTIHQSPVPLYARQQAALYHNQRRQLVQSVPPGIAYQGPQLSQLGSRVLQPQQPIETAANQVAAKFQNYNQPLDAINFAKNSQLQSAPAYQRQQELIQRQLQPQQLQPQYQSQQRQPQPQPQYQPQLQQLQYQPQPQQLQYQPQLQLLQYQQRRLLTPQPQTQSQTIQQQYQQISQYEQSRAIYQSQAPQLEQQVHQVQQQRQQIQYQSQPQYGQLPYSQQQLLTEVSSPANPENQLSYLSLGPLSLKRNAQRRVAPDYRSNVALPTFPPVQYFAKSAQPYYGNHQH